MSSIETGSDVAVAGGGGVTARDCDRVWMAAMGIYSIPSSSISSIEVGSVSISVLVAGAIRVRIDACSDTVAFGCTIGDGIL